MQRKRKAAAEETHKLEQAMKNSKVSSLALTTAAASSNRVGWRRRIFIHIDVNIEEH
jgi:hypothetical protein